MSTYAVRYTAPLWGKRSGYLVPIPVASTSVTIRRDGVATPVYANRSKTALDPVLATGVVPINVASGAVGVDVDGNLTIWTEPGGVVDAVVTVSGESVVVPLPTLAVDAAEPIPAAAVSEAMLAFGVATQTELEALSASAAAGDASLAAAVDAVETALAGKATPSQIDAAIAALSGTYAGIAGANVGIEPVGSTPWLKFVGSRFTGGLVLALDNTLLAGLYPKAPRVLEIDSRGSIVTQAWIAATGDMEPLLSKPAAMIQSRSDLATYDSSFLAQSNVSPQYLFIGGTRSVCRFGIKDDGKISWMSGAWPTVTQTDQPWEAHLAYGGINTVNFLGSLGIAPAVVTPFAASNYDLDVAHPSGLSFTKIELRPGGTQLAISATYGSNLGYDTAPLGVLQFAASGQTSGHRSVAVIEGMLNGTTASQRGGAIVIRTKPNGTANTLTERMRIDNEGVVSIGSAAPGASATVGEIEQTTTGAGHIMKSPDGTRYRLTIANGGTVAVAAA